MIFPSYITELYKAGKVNAAQLADSSRWNDIFSGYTVAKLNKLNSFDPSKADSDSNAAIGLLGINFMFGTNPDFKPQKLNTQLVPILMQDGREDEAPIIYSRLHNFGISFEFVRMPDSSYLILLNDLHELDQLCDRFSKLESNMGDLIDDISRLHRGDDIVTSSIVQSYMILKSK